MNSAKECIYNLLVNDSTLLAMLGVNAPFTNPKAVKSTANSIMPAGKAVSSTATPFITIQGGGRSRVNPLQNLYDEFFYIRCYNDSKKAYVEINTVLARVEALLNNSSLTITGASNVLTTLEASGAEFEDEDLELNFVEARYRVRSLEV
jgi:hypothetical protein